MNLSLCCTWIGCTRIAVLFGRLTSLSSGEDKFWFKRDEIADIASGDSHAAVLTVSGQLFTLGSNEWGQLGVGHTRSLAKPVHVKGELVQVQTGRVACMGCMWVGGSGRERHVDEVGRI